MNKIDNPKINNPIVKNYKIILKTWLHIWWSQDTLKIWWIDSQVVKNPLTWEPYIPWSSLKWRIRALLEMIEYSEKLEAENWKIWPIQNPESEIAKAFWCAWNEAKIASRLIFEDFVLNKKWKKKFKELWSDFFEDKVENTVPRFLSWNSNPRHLERVPAWVEFEWNIILVPEEWKYSIDKNTLKKILNKWIKLLNKTYLWWWGSRWNGRIIMEEKQ